MNRKVPGGLALLLVIPMLLASCGGSDDDDDNGGPESPQLIVTDISWTPANPSPEQSITVSVTIKNDGSANAAASNAYVKVAGTLVCAQIPTPAINAGQSTIVTCAIGTRPAGNHSVESCADITNLVAESNENDNCRTETLTVTNPAEPPNLIVQSITFNPSSPGDDEAVTALVQIRNSGSGAAAASKTEVRVDGAVVCAQIDTPAIPAGQSTTVNCNLGVLDSGTYEVQACSDISTLVAESNEGDNCSSSDLVVEGSQSDVPGIPGLDIKTDVDFCNPTDQNAQLAEIMVESQLSFAELLAALSQLYLNPLEGAEWNDMGGGCRGFTYTFEGCTASYETCVSGDSYNWTLTYDGDCGSQGDPPVTDWVAMRGTTNLDGLVGQFRIYDYNTPTVISSWEWSVAADLKSGTWTFYDGDISPTNINSIIEWVKNADNSENTIWTMPNNAKTESRVSEDGRSGYMRSYTWDGDGSRWILEMEILWDNCHGSQTSYDQDGNVVDQQTW